jgi:hypothetical protein
VDGGVRRQAFGCEPAARLRSGSELGEETAGEASWMVCSRKRRRGILPLSRTLDACVLFLNPKGGWRADRDDHWRTAQVGCRWSHSTPRRSTASASLSCTGTISSGVSCSGYVRPSRSCGYDEVTSIVAPSRSGTLVFDEAKPAVESPKLRVSGRPWNATITIRRSLRFSCPQGARPERRRLRGDPPVHFPTPGSQQARYSRRTSFALRGSATPCPAGCS